MGGIGSGRRASNKKRTVETSLCLNIHSIKRAVRKSEAGLCSITWHIGTQVTSGIITLNEATLCLFLNGKVIEARLQRKYPPFGGITHSLVCGSCAREVSNLYLTEGRLQCRQCSGLVYQSQLESSVGRAHLRVMKAARRLDVEYSCLDRLPERRKGQWRRTYRKRLAKLLSAQQAHYAGLHGLAVNVRAKLSD